MRRFFGVPFEIWKQCFSFWLQNLSGFFPVTVVSRWCQERFLQREWPQFKFFPLRLFAVGSVNILITLYSWRIPQLNTKCDVIVSSQRHTQNRSVLDYNSYVVRQITRFTCRFRHCCLSSRLRNNSRLGVGWVFDLIWLLTNPPEQIALY